MLRYICYYFHPKFIQHIVQGISVLFFGIACYFSPFHILNIFAIPIIFGTIFGIAINIYTCKECIEYFTVDHTFDGSDMNRRLVKSINPYFNAIIWGILLTYNHSIDASVLLSITCAMSSLIFKRNISIKKLALYFAFISLVSWIISFTVAYVERYYLFNWDRVKKDRYKSVPLSYIKKWHECYVIHAVGYRTMKISFYILLLFVILHNLRIINM